MKKKTKEKRLSRPLNSRPESDKEGDEEPREGKKRSTWRSNTTKKKHKSRVVRGTPTHRPCMKRKLNKLSGNEVYYTNSLISPVNNMLHSKLPSQKGFILILISFKVGAGRARQSTIPEDARPTEYGTCQTVKARFWQWHSGKSPSNFFSCSLFARKQTGDSDLCETWSETLNPKPLILKLYRSL